jgi:Haem-binding domain
MRFMRRSNHLFFTERSNRVKPILKWLFVALAAVFVLLQFTNPVRTNPPVKDNFFTATNPPPQIAATLRAACFDCHSSETHWPWYSHVAPISWLVVNDVNNGRKHVDFSDWPDNPDSAARKLENMSDELGYKEMPPMDYTLMHPAARLTDSQRKELIQWADAEAKRLKAVLTNQK